jgi:hypothetical protein
VGCIEGGIALFVKGIKKRIYQGDNDGTMYGFNDGVAVISNTYLFMTLEEILTRRQRNKWDVDYLLLLLLVEVFWICASYHPLVTCLNGTVSSNKRKALNKAILWFGYATGEVQASLSVDSQVIVGSYTSRILVCPQ